LRKNPANAAPTLAQQGVDKNLADRARKAAALIAADRNAGKLAKGTRGSKVKGARVAEKPTLAKGKQSPKGFSKNPLGNPTLASQGVDKHLADRARKATGSFGDPVASLASQGVDKHLADRSRKALGSSKDPRVPVR
jgi:hypothetical protein